tara:strand:+ start:359 stop:484 length:126 start_codon:yes stop_codon:yes gene_type:complete
MVVAELGGVTPQERLKEVVTVVEEEERLILVKPHPNMTLLV